MYSSVGTMVHLNGDAKQDLEVATSVAFVGTASSAAPPAVPAPLVRTAQLQQSVAPPSSTSASIATQPAQHFSASIQQEAKQSLLHHDTAGAEPPPLVLPPPAVMSESKKQVKIANFMPIKFTRRQLPLPLPQPRSAYPLAPAVPPGLNPLLVWGVMCYMLAPISNLQGQVSYSWRLAIQVLPNSPPMLVSPPPMMQQYNNPYGFYHLQTLRLPDGAPVSVSMPLAL